MMFSISFISFFFFIGFFLFIFGFLFGVGGGHSTTLLNDVQHQFHQFFFLYFCSRDYDVTIGAVAHKAGTYAEVKASTISPNFKKVAQ